MQGKRQCCEILGDKERKANKFWDVLRGTTVDIAQAVLQQAVGCVSGPIKPCTGTELDSFTSKTRNRLAMMVTVTQ